MSALLGSMHVSADCGDISVAAFRDGRLMVSFVGTGMSFDAHLSSADAQAFARLLLVQAETSGETAAHERRRAAA